MKVIKSMTFITYAQNFEDVILWRALHNVENGFYVDVGANDPKLLSLTRAFYERGWHGINIEPAPSLYERLNSERMRDINLAVAAGAIQDEITFYEIPDTALSTSNQSIAKNHQLKGRIVFERKVTVLTLNQILQEHTDGPVHFMNIDVEGDELNVLKGLDLSRWRPWIMVIEATMPETRESSFEIWEHLLLSANYEFVYFDALNRFYLAKEHSELKDSFLLPPNLFDNFIFNKQEEDNNEIKRLGDLLKTKDIGIEYLHKRELKLETELGKENIYIQDLVMQISKKDEGIDYLNNALREKDTLLQSIQDRLSALENLRKNRWIRFLLKFSLLRWPGE